MDYSPQHNVMVYRDVNVDQVKASIASAMPVNGNAVAIPFTMAEMQLARWIGLPAASPIERDYDWPAHPGIKPMAQQVRMAAFMTLHPRCFNLSDMRTGKTLSALWAYDYLKGLGLVNRCLVVGRLSTLERVWLNELFKNFLGRLSGVVLHGTRKERQDDLDREHDVYIINYDGLHVGNTRTSRGLVFGGVAASIRDRQDIDCIIIDESSAYRNSGTLRWKVMKQILGDKPYVWQLTGTPTPNAPTDAHAQKRLVFPQTESFVVFRQKTMMQFGKFIWKPKKDAAETVSRFLTPSIRFERAECMDLPDMVYDPPREVELSKEQAEHIDKMTKELAITMASGAKITAVNEAGLRMKLIQIVCGAIYDANHKAHFIDCQPRLDALRETIEEAGGKLLVFAPLTSVVEMLHRVINKWGYGCEKVIGDTGPKERNEIFLRFDSDDVLKVIVADPGTVAHGLDLSAAHTIIWYGPTDRVEDYTQANVRISGPRQTRGMLIVRLVATAIEKEIFARLDAKQSLQGLILDLVRSRR